MTILLTNAARPLASAYSVAERQRILLEVGAAALAPMAVKGVGKLVRDMGMQGVQDALKSPGQAVKGMAADAGDHLGSQLGDYVSGHVLVVDR